MTDGSLMPKIMEDRKSGVCELTDPRMTRFFMTLGEAVALVRRAAESAPAGSVLIPVLPSVRVTDVIAALAPDCEVKVIGIRGAEKIHECMVSADEAPIADRFGSDYCLGLPTPKGIGGAYDSGTNPDVLSVEAIRERTPQAMAEAG